MSATSEGTNRTKEDGSMMRDEFDKIEHMDGALIQHGPLNDRVYLMKMGDTRPDELVDGLLRKAVDEGYSKVFAKIPESAAEPFKDAGFQKEARVPGFFNGREPASFMGYYLDSDRRQEENPEKLDAILALSRNQSASGDLPPLPENKFVLRQCRTDEVKKMADIYRKIFPTYPFPIHEPDYLRDTMGSHVVYFGAVADGQLIALSSSEIDRKAKNTEMTDFATLPGWRGNRLGTHLLSLMEGAVKKKKIKTAYTIARAASPGMNITFARSGYQFGGRLINNTNISGQIESMNIWYKPLMPGAGEA